MISEFVGEPTQAGEEAPACLTRRPPCPRLDERGLQLIATPTLQVVVPSGPCSVVPRRSYVPSRKCHLGDGQRRISGEQTRVGVLDQLGYFGRDMCGNIRQTSSKQDYASIGKDLDSVVGVLLKQPISRAEMVKCAG
jgi:hypothetical protein